MFAALIKPKWKPNSKDTLYEFFWCSLVTSTASLHDWSSVAQIHFVQQFASVRERTRLQHAIETEPAFRLLVQHALFLAQVGATATGRSISWKSKLEKTCHRHKHLKHITLATISKQHFHTRHHQGQIPNGTKLHWVLTPHCPKFDTLIAHPGRCIQPGHVAMWLDSLRSSWIVVASTLRRSRS